MKVQYAVRNAITGETKVVESMGAAAKEIGVSRQAVSDMVNKGAISRAGHTIEVIEPLVVNEIKEVPFYEGNEDWREVHSRGKQYKYYVNKKGEIRNEKGKVLIANPTQLGYYRVQLGQSNFQYVHRIVAIAWYGDRSGEGLEVNHIDGDKSNNTVENLEWVSHKENCLHREMLKRAKVSDFEPIDLHLKGGK